MNRLGIAVLLAIVAKGATAGKAGQAAPSFVEGKGVAVVGSDAGITEFPIWLMVGLMLGSPHERTKTTSSRYGIQAMNIWPPV